MNTIEYLDLKSNEWTTFVPKGSCDGLIKRKPRSRKNSRKSVSEEKKSLNTPEEIVEIATQALDVGTMQPEVVKIS